MNDLDKKNYYNILFGYYGNLLTEKQQNLFEEYYGEELQVIDEFQYFKAEDYSVLELIKNQNEEFKVPEIEVGTDV